MKISSTFSDRERCITLTPEDELEKAILDDIASRSEKGSTLKVSKIVTPEDKIEVTFRINGK